MAISGKTVGLDKGSHLKSFKRCTYCMYLLHVYCIGGSELFFPFLLELLAHGKCTSQGRGPDTSNQHSLFSK